MSFFIFIETLTPSIPKLDDVVLKVEVINDGEVIGSHLIQGNTFHNMGKSEPKTTYLYAIFKGRSKNNKDSHNIDVSFDPEMTVRYFEERKKAIYRFTVIHPCEKHENVSMELRSARCY